MSARARLTLSYTAVMTLLLIGFAALSYVLLARALDRALDDSMRKTAREAMAALEDETREMGGHLTPGAAADALATFRSDDRAVILRGSDGSDVARSGPHIRGGRFVNVGQITVEQSRFPFLGLASRAMAIATLIAVVISAFVSWILAGRAIGPIEAAVESQRRFMADASHELRTPVAILQGESGVALSRERDPAEYRQSLEVMQRATRQLARIVRDLFLLARADVGNLQPQRSRFYLEEAIASTIQSLRTVAEEKGTTLAESHDAEMPIDADEDLVKELLLNLIGNAIQHGGGDVSVAARRDAALYAIEVRDRGAGIPAERQPLIFDRFYRAEHSGPGAGLGLPIARSIARAHGGDVTLRESSAAGTTFVATLAAPE